MPDAAESDFLYRYISREQFRRRKGFFHPDPLIEEFTYGEGGAFSSLLWRHIHPGCRLFFHTKIGGVRYLTAMYHVIDYAPGSVMRLDATYTSTYRNPHICPHLYSGWAQRLDFKLDRRIKRDFFAGSSFELLDLVVIGDPERSFDLRNTPVVLDRRVLERLDMWGSPVKWDIVDKNGRAYDEARCIDTCLRAPRRIEKHDGDYLSRLVSRRLEFGEEAAEVYSPISTVDASEITAISHSEREIEQYLADNISALGDLKVVARQFRLPDDGRIDILAKDSEGGPVIIEVKKGTADDATVAQLLCYIRQYRNTDEDASPRGMIVCGSASYRLRAACAELGISVHYYGDCVVH